MRFRDRVDAGKKLAKSLSTFSRGEDLLVLGLARGGVVVAHEVASILSLPLDVLVVRKIGAPHNPELALGAVTEEGEGFFNEELIELLGVSREYLRAEISLQKKRAKERLLLYRGNYPAHSLRKKRVILVDDGVATGASVRAALRFLRFAGVSEIILALPVAAPDSLEILKKEADEVFCLHAPASFEAVGDFYESFGETKDEEVIALLQ